jgi:hypothetical protein
MSLRGGKGGVGCNTCGKAAQTVGHVTCRSIGWAYDEIAKQSQAHTTKCMYTKFRAAPMLSNVVACRT